MQVQIIEDDCDLLWYLNPEKRPDVRCVEESLEFGGDLFELRCLGASKVVDSGNQKSWNGSVWFRYGTKLFRKWWKLERNGCRVSKEVTLADFEWEDLDVAIYVRVKVVELEKYKRDYLAYIGGQN